MSQFLSSPCHCLVRALWNGLKRKRWSSYLFFCFFLFFSFFADENTVWGSPVRFYSQWTMVWGVCTRLYGFFISLYLSFPVFFLFADAGRQQYSLCCFFPSHSNMVIVIVNCHCKISLSLSWRHLVKYAIYLDYEFLANCTPNYEVNEIIYPSANLAHGDLSQIGTGAQKA